MRGCFGVTPEQQRRYDKEKELHRRTMLEFVHDVAFFQMGRGAHFVGEQPLTATSWTEAPILRVRDVCFEVTLDMCVFGLKCPETGEAIMKPTKIVCSSSSVVESLTSFGRGGRCTKDHSHRRVQGGVQYWDDRSLEMRRCPLNIFCGGYTIEFARVLVQAFNDELAAHQVYTAGFQEKRARMDMQEYWDMHLMIDPQVIARQDFKKKQRAHDNQEWQEMKHMIPDEAERRRQEFLKRRRLIDAAEMDVIHSSQKREAGPDSIP